MQLREVIKKIRQEKNWTQVEMAEQLSVKQQNIQGMENAGSNLEKQFAIFLKIFPLCKSLGIDPTADAAQKLSSQSLAGGIIDEAMDKATGGADGKATKGGKKRDSYLLPPSRNSRSSRKKKEQDSPKVT